MIKFKLLTQLKDAILGNYKSLKKFFHKLPDYKNLLLNCNIDALIQLFLGLLPLNIDLIISEKSGFVGAFSINYLFFKINLKLVLALLIVVCAFIKNSKLLKILSLKILLILSLIHVLFAIIFITSHSDMFPYKLWVILGLVWSNINMFIYILAGLIILIYIPKIKQWAHFIHLTIVVLFLEIIIELLQIFYPQFATFKPFVILGSPATLISKINIFRFYFFRGYGTTPHPNILAFIAFFELTLIDFIKDHLNLKSNNKSLKVIPQRLKIFKTCNASIFIAKFLTLLIIVLTFSKAGIILSITYLVIKGSSNIKSLKIRDFLGKVNLKFILIISLIINIIFTVLLINLPNYVHIYPVYFLQMRSLIWQEYLKLSFRYPFYVALMFLIGGGNNIGILMLIKDINWVFYTYNFRILIEPIHNIVIKLLMELGIIESVFIFKILSKFDIFKYREFKIWLFLILGLWGAVDHIF